MSDGVRSVLHNPAAPRNPDAAAMHDSEDAGSGREEGSGPGGASKARGPHSGRRQALTLADKVSFELRISS
jgi:hypothetical protein